MSSDFILMKNKLRCPACGVRRHFNPGTCHNCGVRLFTSDDTQDFSAFEEGSGIVNWWAFSRERGWVYRDYYMVEGARPQVKRFVLPEIPKNYGKELTPDGVRAKKAQTKRIVKKQGMMKINPRQALSSRVKN